MTLDGSSLFCSPPGSLKVIVLYEGFNADALREGRPDHSSPASPVARLCPLCCDLHCLRPGLVQGHAVFSSHCSPQLWRHYPLPRCAFQWLFHIFRQTGGVFLLGTRWSLVRCVGCHTHFPSPLVFMQSWDCLLLPCFQHRPTISPPARPSRP